MSKPRRKNKSSQSPKQETERASEKAMRKSAEAKTKRNEAQASDGGAIADTTKTDFTTPEDKDADIVEKEKHDPNTPFSFELILNDTNTAIAKAAVDLEIIARRLNTETIFGIPAARFQAYADKIRKYPKQLKNKAAKERRRLTQTETKEEKKEKKSKAIREKIEALQTKLAKL